MLLCVAMCCGVLQCGAVLYYSLKTAIGSPRTFYVCLLQCVAVCCSVLQCVAVCRSVLQCVALYCSVFLRVGVCWSVLHCVAVCCSAVFISKENTRESNLGCLRLIGSLKL